MCRLRRRRPEEVYSKDGELKHTIKVRAARFLGPASFNTRSYSRNGFPGKGYIDTEART